MFVDGARLAVALWNRSAKDAVEFGTTGCDGTDIDMITLTEIEVRTEQAKQCFVDAQVHPGKENNAAQEFKEWLKWLVILDRAQSGERPLLEVMLR